MPKTAIALWFLAGGWCFAQTPVEKTEKTGLVTVISAWRGLCHSKRAVDICRPSGTVGLLSFDRSGRVAGNSPLLPERFDRPLV